MRLKNYAMGEWVEGTGAATDLFHAVTGEKVTAAFAPFNIVPIAGVTRNAAGGPGSVSST